MSSKRGRKRNDNLPPNRARDVQRAFRARRAAHLIAMEERVAELEDENDRLRAALNMPPAARPTLGKGPTGKDKPKSRSYDSRGPSDSADANGDGAHPPLSRGTSSASSTRAQSISPSASNGLHPSPPTLDTGSGWSEIMPQGAPDGAKTGPHPSPTSTTFSPPTSVTNGYNPSPSQTPFAPLSPSFASSSTSSGPFPPSTAPGNAFQLSPVAQKGPQPSPYSYSPHVPPGSSRPPLAGTVYMNYSSVNGPSYLEPPHSYAVSPISPHDPNGMHAQQQQPPSSLQLGGHQHPPPTHGNVSYTQRRALTDPHTHGYRPLGGHQGYLAQSAAGRMQHGGSGEARLNPI